MPVEIVPLDPSQGCKYAALFRRNVAYLRAEPDEVSRTDEEFASSFGEAGDANLKFGIRLAGLLIGRVDLNPVAPPKYAVGYWIDAEHTGCGHASSAVALAMAFARDDLGATDVYGGVDKGNEASVRVLQRNGFVWVADLGSYDRFHLPLDGGAPRNPD